ncbi:unnamed protein product, partial [Meganyctiphanes norvegica]
VELQVKLRCEEQERLGPLQHSSSLRRQQRPLSLRPRCRSLKALHTRRRNHIQTRHISATGVQSTGHTPALRTPADDRHIPSCPSSRANTPFTTSVRTTENSHVASKVGNTSTSSGVGKTQGRLQRQSRRSKIRRREYRRLRNLLPSLQEEQQVSKVDVVAEAARYIDDLHARLLHRLKTRGLPHQVKDLPICIEEVNEGNIQDLVRHILTVINPVSLPPTKIENTRLLPSFIGKTSNHKRP